MSSAATLNQSSPLSMNRVPTGLSTGASTGSYVNTVPFASAPISNFTMASAPMSTFTMASAPGMMTGALSQTPLSTFSTGATGALSGMPLSSFSTGSTGALSGMPLSSFSTGATGALSGMPLSSLSSGATGGIAGVPFAIDRTGRLIYPNSLVYCHKGSFSTAQDYEEKFYVSSISNDRTLINNPGNKQFIGGLCEVISDPPSGASSLATGTGMVGSHIDLNLINETLNGVVQRLGLIQKIIPGITDADLMSYMAGSTEGQPVGTDTPTQGTAADTLDTPMNNAPLNDEALNDEPGENPPRTANEDGSETTNSDTTNSNTPPSENNSDTPPPENNSNEPPPDENNQEGGGKKKSKRKTRRRNKRGLNSTR